MLSTIIYIVILNFNKKYFKSYYYYLKYISILDNTNFIFQIYYIIIQRYKSSS